MVLGAYFGGMVFAEIAPGSKCYRAEISTAASRAATNALPALGYATARGSRPACRARGPHRRIGLDRR
ncbi:hypothetical protein [Saccharothrix sp. Mg75]|uniref:hypothetical protein n=1 Tax=Saccharothrix sp. Mg75 TaxID=3445357 RepID=UPI003EEBE026